MARRKVRSGTLIRRCIKFKRVRSRKLRKTVRRCAKFKCRRQR